jgi:hypothetical protein
MRKRVVLSVLLFALATPAWADFKSAADSVDDTIKEVTLQKVLPTLASIFDVEAPVLEKAMLETKWKLSDVSMAKFVSEKNGQKVAELLKGAAVEDWPSILKKNSLSERDAEEFLDNMQSEIALAMLDFREKRKK